MKFLLTFFIINNFILFILVFYCRQNILFVESLYYSVIFDIT